MKAKKVKCNVIEKVVNPGGMYIKGTARADKKTKNLVKRLLPHEIAVINHHDLDKVAAQSLVAAKVRAVINAAPSLSDDYPNLGPLDLLEAGIYLLDNVGPEIMNLIDEETEVEIKDEYVFINGKLAAGGKVLTIDLVKKHMEDTKQRLGYVLGNFIENTLEYAHNEIDLVCGQLEIPKVNTVFQGRHTLIVVRGNNYKEDLSAIKSYVDEVRPVLIGVDGGADALLEFGYKPDIIIGDMDSITDKSLACGAELVVHAYPNGKAPGLQRVQDLGLSACIFPAPGTSEDIAMLLAYENDTELIVAVGTHSNMLDFLEKGRKGMASTFLVRLKVGPILVDAKGVNRLYKSPLKIRHLAELVLAALVPLAIFMVISPLTRQWLRLVLMQVRMILGI